MVWLIVIVALIGHVVAGAWVAYRGERNRLQGKADCSRCQHDLCDFSGHNKRFAGEPFALYLALGYLLLIVNVAYDLTVGMSDFIANKAAKSVEPPKSKFDRLIDEFDQALDRIERHNRVVLVGGKDERDTLDWTSDPW